MFSNTTKRFSNSQKAPTGCLINLTQFWHYIPGDSIRFHRLKAQSHKTALLQTLRAGCRLCSWLTGSKAEVPRTPSSGLSSSWNGSQTQGSICLCFQFIIKDTDRQSDEDVHRVRSQKVPSVGASVPMEVGCITFLACECIQQLGNSSHFIVQDIV